MRVGVFNFEGNDKSLYSKNDSEQSSRLLPVIDWLVVSSNFSQFPKNNKVRVYNIINCFVLYLYDIFFLNSQVEYNILYSIYL